jgi:hypothetical protein
LTLADALLLLVVLSLFLALACYQLELPGLHYDEAKEAGNNALQLLKGLPVQSFRGASIRLARHDLPLMVQDYIGALNVYLSMPLLAVLGVSVPALRLLPVLAASATLVLLYLLARETCGRWVGAVSVLMLAVNPSYVFWSRQGIFVTNTTATLAVASALTAYRWYRRRRVRHLYLTALLWGLGIYAKLLFVWMVGATLGIGLVLLVARWLSDAKDRRQESPRSSEPWPALRLPRVSVSRAAVAAACFLAPLVPLLVFNIRTGGTLTSLFSNLDSSYYGVRNAAFFRNAADRLKQLLVLLRGEHLWYLGDRIANPVAQWIAAGLLLSLLLLGLGARLRRASRPVPVGTWLMPALFCLLVVIQSSFTVSDLFVTHHASLLPFLFLAVAAVAGGVTHRQGHAWLVPVLGALIWWASLDLRGTLRYHQALTATGGHAAHSDAVYDLAEYLDERDIRSPLVLDWGIAAPLVFLTGGRVHPVEIFGYERVDAPGEGFGERLRASLAESSSHAYLFHVPEETVFAGRRELFDRVVADAGLVPRVEEAFYERSGRMLFVLTRVQRP